MERRELLSTFVVTNTSDGPSPSPFSLRWAILQVNAATGPGAIQFNIPGGGVQSIQLTSPLPPIVNPVVIDGTTEPEHQNSPLIQLDGSQLASGSDGLVISGGDSTVEGLAIVSFPGSAIVVNSLGGNVVAANYLGVTVAGNQAEANGVGITVIDSSANTIGGTTAAAGNVIAGNDGNGIEIDQGSGSATSNEILANLIGTAANGTVALGNGQAGIVLNGASGTLIGLPATGLGNVIAGNVGPGIEVLAGASGTVLQNNSIGVARDRQTPLGNHGDGILLDNAPNAQVGGTGISQGNLIGCNQGNGIETEDNTAGLWVAGNMIGTDATGTLHLGNRSNGVELGSSSNTIGGTAAGAGNTIDYNGSGQAGSGVLLVGSVDADEILSDSIYGNAGIGINLGNGPTSNHAPGTPGPNNYQNYPTLSLAQSDGSSTTIQGSLYSIPNSGFVIQFFSSPTEDRTGFGQGQVMIGSDQVQTDQNGNATFTVPLPAGLSPGAYISATATGPGGNTSEFASDVQLQGEFSLVLSASATPNPVASGGRLTYTLTVANSGNLAANGVILTDLLPGGVLVLSASPTQGGVYPSFAGGSVTAALGTVPAGGSAALVIVVQTGTSSVGIITDTASVSSLGTDPTPADESASVTTTVVTSADLSIGLVASPNPVMAGGQLTDTITVLNLGPQAASGVIVTLPLPQGVVLVSADPGQGTVTSSGGQVVANLGNLAATTPATLTVIVQPTTAGTLIQTATVSSTSIDPNLSNNTSSATVQVDPSADLALSITTSASQAETNQDFQYTVLLTNNGPSPAAGVELTDTLPAGVTYVSASAGMAGTPSNNSGVVSLSIATVADGATVTMTILVDTTAAPGSTLNDLAVATGLEADPDPADSSASVLTPVVGVSDLGIAATAPSASVYVGQNVTYTLTATNSGPDPEPDAVVSCPIPPDVALVPANGATGPAPSLQSGILTAELGPLAVGATDTFSVILCPQAAAAGTLTTRFSIAGVNADPDSTNNTSAVTVTVTPAADLGIDFSTAAAGPAVAADWTITMNVANLGLSDATGVTAVFPLPQNVQFISATSTQGLTPVVSNGVLSADLEALAAGSSATVSVVVVPTAVGSVALSATVSGDQYDPQPANNQATALSSVAPSVNMTVQIVPTPATVVTGQPLTFVAIVANSGPDPATNVVLTLPMGSGLVLNSSTASPGTCGLTGDQVLAQLGQIDPGASAKVTLVVTPQNPGTITQTASVASAEHELDLAGTTAGATVTVLESPGTLQFGAALYSVPETAGTAVLSVIRTGGSLGTVTVPYQTVAVNATPGLDFVATAGTLTFASGQTAGTIRVPVLADPWDDHDEYVDVVLGSPGGGASLGMLSTAQLRIIDVDPNHTPPLVSQLSWTGTSKSITSVNLAFSAPLASAYATNPANYVLTVRGQSKPTIQFNTVSYNLSNRTVTLVPTAPLSSGQFYQIEVMGTGATAIRDIAGNLLDGAANGLTGSNYVAYFGQGTSLQYVDNSGNQVSLKLSGPGYLQDVLDSSSQGQVLTIIGEVPRRTTLSGSVRKSRGSSGRTNLGIIQGLGNFGDVRVSLKSPPFVVRQYPFQRSGKGIL